MAAGHEDLFSAEVPAQRQKPGNWLSSRFDDQSEMKTLSILWQRLVDAAGRTYSVFIGKRRLLA